MKPTKEEIIAPMVWRGSDIDQDVKDRYKFITVGDALRAMEEYASQFKQDELICPHCGKYKTMQGNGIMHQLCECGKRDESDKSLKEELPCGNTGCINPHEYVYRGCDLCKYVLPLKPTK